ncbi:hypothetical protein Tcan_17301 [Toxocara canis]|nr:hypothetical protein Tcan_17301 [Toxocara canis]
MVQEMRNDDIPPEESESSSLSYNSKSNSPPPGAPLNLTKVNNSSSINDNDSLDRNSSDRSMNPSLTDQDSSSNQNTPTEGEQALQFALSKLVGLIEVATSNFKAQRDIIDNEKTFAQKLQTELEMSRNNQQRLQRELAQERRKSRVYFRRFCKAKQESLDLRTQLAQLGTRTRRRSI